MELGPGALAVAEHLGRADEAIQYLKKALDRNPNFVEARGLLGNALAAKGDGPEALRQYRLALQARPEPSRRRTPVTWRNGANC